jgi:hypothetical protein
MKASDIPDEEVLGFVLSINEQGRWCQSWDLEERFPEYPLKVVKAKCAGLIRRGYMDGCTCGCRGDYVVIGGPRDYI